MATSKSGAGGRLARSEVVTVRLDPKLRYIAELAARKQRRTLSSFVEWALERSLDSVSAVDGRETFWAEADYLWDVDESDRFVKLAMRHPELLTHDEQILWKIVREQAVFWKGKYDYRGEWTWEPKEGNIVFEHLRKSWSYCKAAASGDILALAKIPKVPHKEPKVEKEDDIPF